MEDIQADATGKRTTMREKTKITTKKTGRMGAATASINYAGGQ